PGSHLLQRQSMLRPREDGGRMGRPLAKGAGAASSYLTAGVPSFFRSPARRQTRLARRHEHVSLSESTHRSVLGACRLSISPTSCPTRRDRRNEGNYPFNGPNDTSSFAATPLSKTHPPL